MTQTETSWEESIRGLTEENTQLVIISPIGHFKSPIGNILANWGLVIFYLTLRHICMAAADSEVVLLELS